MSEIDICISELRKAAQSLNAVADKLATLKQPEPITLEQVRAVLAEKSRSGHTAKVRAILEKHGAPKLSEINPGEYRALLEEAEVLGNE